MKTTKKSTIPMMTLLTALLLTVAASGVQAQTQLILESAEPAGFTQQVQQKTQDLLAALTEFTHTGTADFADEPGVADIHALLQTYPLRSNRDTLYSRIIRMSGEVYEVRELFVQTGDQEYEFMELVVVFDNQPEIIEIRMANELHNFDRVLSRATLAEQQDQEQVGQLMQRFAEAFSDKDIASLRALIAEDALVISGSVSNGQVVYTRTEADTYLERLERIVFPNNELVDVRFDQIQVFVNPGYRNVYGVSLYQYWNTSNYSDEGYVAFMVDLREAERPQIHTRFWQPAPFEVGRFAQLEPDPLPLHLQQGAIRAHERSEILLTLESADQQLLHAEMVPQWLAQNILEIPGVIVDSEAIEVISEQQLRVPFGFEDETRNVQDVTLRIYDTALLQSLRSPLRLVAGHSHQLRLTVLEDEQAEGPESPPYADIWIQGEPEDAEVRLIRISDSTVVIDPADDAGVLFARSQPGAHRMVVEKQGYERYEASLFLRAGSLYEASYRLEKIVIPEPQPEPVAEVVAEEEAGFYARNRLLVWTAVAATTLGTAAVLVNGGSDGGTSAPAVFPSPPGRP